MLISFAHSQTVILCGSKAVLLVAKMKLRGPRGGEKKGAEMTESSDPPYF